MEPEEKAAELIKKGKTVALTGAGVSTASGLPDFRGENGLWSKYDPSIFHIDTFRSNPDRFWEKWREIQQEIQAGEDINPNPAHDALTEMYTQGEIESVITQNVDGLHQESGMPDKDVIEVHGNTRQTECEKCSSTQSLDKVIEENQGEMAPKCSCGGVLKPNSILFGEPLPQKEINRAHTLAGICDTIIVAGSSLTVQPVSRLPKTAMLNGAELILLNKDETQYDGEAALTINKDVTETLPKIQGKL